MARALLKLPGEVVMRTSLFRSLLCLTLCSLPALAYELRTDSEGDLVKWTRPLVLTIDASLGERLHARGAIEAVQRAVAHVDEATPGLEVSATVGAAKPIGYQVGASDNTNSVLVLEDWPYSERALAVTLVTLNARTNELLDADVAFNADEHRFQVLADGSQGHAFDDVQNTITHELGHVLGLMHNANVQDLVMFPSAPPGEVIKRQLKQDDRDGLLSLYKDPVAPALEQPLPAQGCSSTGAQAPLLAAFGALFLVLLRRPRRAARAAAKVAVLVLVPAAVAQAGESETAQADEVVLATVSARASFVHPQRPGLILTRLTLAQAECLKGRCAVPQEVVVPGGRVGDLEQVVIHEPVPLPGERTLVTRTGGKLRLLHLEPARQLAVIQLLRAESAATSSSPRPPFATSQPPATTP